MAEYKEHPQLQKAISLAQSGKVEDAHALLHKITSEDPTEEMAWLWLVQTEPDHQERIKILEECLRHNPQSEYARKGLAGFRTGPLTGKRPPGKPPTYMRPKKGTGPLKRQGCRWKTLLLLGALASAVTLVIAGILFYPQWKGLLPAIGLPDLSHIVPPSSTPTPTSTLVSPTASFTATRSDTPSKTSTKSRTMTATLTRTPTVSLTPTLFQGVPVGDEPALLFLAVEACEVMRLPISGGTPESLTKEIPADCAQPKISPDGLKLAFVALPDSNTIQMTNLDGSWKKMVTRLAANTGSGRTIWSLEWAPDGKSIAFVASAFSKDPQGNNQVADTTGYLYTVSMGSGFAKQLKALGVERDHSASISWSPDSNWVFAFDKGNPVDAISYPYAFRVSDSRTISITFDQNGWGHYDWSPDSLSLSGLLPQKPTTSSLPAEAPANQTYLMLAGLDESKHYLPLAEKGYSPEFGARWFPDKTGFLLYNARSKYLVSISAEGALLDPIVSLEYAPSFISWSPDKQWIAIIEESAPGEPKILMIVHPDGTGLRILSRDVGTAQVVWV
jgi:hypothetical protein